MSLTKETKAAKQINDRAERIKAFIRLSAEIAMLNAEIEEKSAKFSLISRDKDETSRRFRTVNAQFETTIRASFEIETLKKIDQERIQVKSKSSRKSQLEESLKEKRKRMTAIKEALIVQDGNILSLQKEIEQKRKQLLAYKEKQAEFSAILRVKDFNYEEEVLKELELWFGKVYDDEVKAKDDLQKEYDRLFLEETLAKQLLKKMDSNISSLFKGESSAEEKLRAADRQLLKIEEADERIQFFSQQKQEMEMNGADRAVIKEISKKIDAEYVKFVNLSADKEEEFEKRKQLIKSVISSLEQFLKKQAETDRSLREIYEKKIIIGAKISHIISTLDIFRSFIENIQARHAELQFKTLHLKNSETLKVPKLLEETSAIINQLEKFIENNQMIISQSITNRNKNELAIKILQLECESIVNQIQSLMNEIFATESRVKEAGRGYDSIQAKIISIETARVEITRERDSLKTSLEQIEKKQTQLEKAMIMLNTRLAEKQIEAGFIKTTIEAFLKGLDDAASLQSIINDASKKLSVDTLKKLLEQAEDVLVRDNIADDLEGEINNISKNEGGEIDE